MEIYDLETNLSLTMRYVSYYQLKEVILPQPLRPGYSYGRLKADS